ncbi:MAG: hypothetical protein LBU17_02510 [Treponema sp.]|jgi:hypothetical protein|nr:hypothetical protein [Treponema sp.]
MNEKTSSLYNERYNEPVTNGSSNELDEYGVWVKSEPQSLSSLGDNTEALTELKFGSDDDLSFEDTLGGDTLPEISDLSTNKDALSDDGEGALMGFDALVEPDNLQELSDPFVSTDASDAGVFDLGALPDDDLSLEALSDEATVDIPLDTALAEEVAEVPADTAPEEVAEVPPVDEAAEVPLDTASAEEVAEIPAVDEAAEVPVDTAPAEEVAEIPAVDEAAEVPADTAPEEVAEVPAVDEAAEVPADTAPVEEVAEIPAVDEAAEVPVDTAPVAEVAEVPAVDEAVEVPVDTAPVEEVAEIPPADETAEVPLAAAPADEATEVPLVAAPADEVVAVDEAAEVVPSGDGGEPPRNTLPPEPDHSNGPPQSPGSDILSQLLMKIVEELSLIRTELSGIKQEFGALHREAPGVEAQVSAEVQPLVDEPAQEENHDFFDGEADETTALTGDELNNILNTVDLIEESPPLDDDVVLPDHDLSCPELEGGLEEIALESSLVLENEEVVKGDDSEELQQLREEGAKPYTEAPDPIDTSYLEEDPFAKLDFIQPTIDLSNAVIDGPDLSADIKENPVEEPVLEDISIDDLDIDEEDEDEEEVDFPMLTGIEASEDAPCDDAEAQTPEPDQDQPEGDTPEPENTKVLSDDVLDEVLAEAGLQDIFAFMPEDGDTGGEQEPEPHQADTVDTAAVDKPDTEDAVVVDNADTADATTVDKPDTEDAAVADKPDTVDAPVLPAPVSPHLKEEIKTVLAYMDQLLESLPEEKIAAFASSEYFGTYKKLFTELGLV